MKLITPEIEARFKEVGDQSQTLNPIIVAKFFDPVGSATWHATQYDQETNVCYGYVTGLTFDEWGRFSIDEMEAVERPFGLTIERDIYFNEKRFYDQFPEQKRLAELEQLKKGKSKSQEQEC